MEGSVIECGDVIAEIIQMFYYDRNITELFEDISVREVLEYLQDIKPFDGI